MASAYYPVGNTPSAADHKEAIRQLAAAWDKFTHLRGSIIETKDGPSTYTSVVTRYGYVDATAAAASFTEIDSAYNAGNAAIMQMVSRHL